MDRISRCKRCDAELIWALTPKGKMTPLDAKPVRIAQIMNLGSIPKIEESHDGYVSHFKTCTNPESWRGNGDGSGCDGTQTQSRSDLTHLNNSQTVVTETAT